MTRRKSAIELDALRNVYSPPEEASLLVPVVYYYGFLRFTQVA